MAQMAVCIVNHNTRELLRACLKSVQRESPGEVIAVDNASSDGSAEMVKTEFPSVRLMKNDDNPGYGASANRAIRNSTSRYVLLLNSDTRLQSGALKALRIYLDQNPRTAIVGPRLVNPDGTLQQSCFYFPTPLEIFLDASYISRLFQSVPVIRNSYLRTWPHTHIRSVPWILGAAMAIRREAFQAVGGFDDTFFLYYEEVDLCYRLAQCGWKIHFAPVTDVIHLGGASTSQRRADMTVQLYAGLAHFYRRHYSRIRMAELAILVECIAFGRLVRDAISLHLERDELRRANLSADLISWQQLLLGRWRRQAVHT